MHFYIVLAISVFAGRSLASVCTTEVTAKEPSYEPIGKFGELHILNISSTSSQTLCVWKFSSPRNYYLNLLFINFTTTENTVVGSDCKGSYASIKIHDSETGTAKTLDRYCGQRRMSGIRINGTVEIEMHRVTGIANDGDVSMTAFVESSSKDCGGIFNESSHGIPLSYDSSTRPKSQLVHCVWFFEFLSPRQLSIVISLFDLEYDYSSTCGNIKEFLSMRAWNRKNGKLYQEQRECQSYVNPNVNPNGTPLIFNVARSNRFAITVHSDEVYSSKKLHGICLPSTTGFSNASLKISGIGNITYKDATLHEKSQDFIEGLLVLKPKDAKEDQLFFKVSHAVQKICKDGKLEVWSTMSGIFWKNSSLCDDAKNNPYSLFGFEDISLLYFRTMAESMREFQIWYYTSTKGCGGLFQLVHGKSIDISSPKDGAGTYPNNLKCRWGILADQNTELNSEFGVLDVEDCSNRWYDYIILYQGLRSQRSELHKFCKNPKPRYGVTGDMIIWFKTDGNTQKEGFSLTVTAFDVTANFGSCIEALSSNENRPGLYYLNVSGMQLIVRCELKAGYAVTTMKHANVGKTIIVNSGIYRHEIKYAFSIESMTNVIDTSDRCQQAFNTTCKFSRISYYSWLTNRKNKKMSYWAGGPSNGTGCACGITNTCVNRKKKCNCDAAEYSIRYDYGLVTKKSDLPVTAIRTGDTTRSYYKKFTIGNIICFAAIPQTTAAAITTSKKTTVTTISSTTLKTGTKTKTKLIPKDSTSKQYPAVITTPTNKVTKSGVSRYATATTKITIIGKKGQSSSGNITVYAIGAVSGILVVIFIVVLIIIIRRRQARSTTKDSDETSSRKERPRQNSAMPLVEMTERPKPFVPDASVTYSVPDNCHQETEATEWNNPYYESSNDIAPPTMEAENLYYGSNVGMTMENPYYESSDQVHTEAEYETTCPDEHLYAAPDANPSKPVYSYATTEELKSGVTGNCEENIYEYADAEQVL